MVINCDVTYCPPILPIGAPVSGAMRRQELTITSTPCSMASGPR